MTKSALSRIIPDVIVSLAYDNPAPLNYGDRSITDARYVRVKMQHSFYRNAEE
jgi:hypothetical protein